VNLVPRNYKAFIHCMTKVEISHYYSLFDITLQQNSTKVDIFRHYFLRYFDIS
jgi:hypothetical protein